MLQTILLALVQGLTEFLPISSSAHLILIPQLTDWSDQGLAFDVAVHFGTLIAVVLYFRNDLWLLASQALRQPFTLENPQTHLSWCIVVATIPAVIAGFLFKDFIETHLRTAEIIAYATLFFGVLLGVSARFNKQLTLLNMTLTLALIIGIFQAFALIPGTSRSGITITAALFLGFSNKEAARFSFLLSVPIILAASTLLGIKLWSDTQNVQPIIFLVGIAVSAISAWLCIHWFLRLIDRIGMLPFVVYRLVLGAFLLFTFT